MVWQPIPPISPASMALDTDPDHQLMARALDLAARATGHTAPNPLVGCVIVADGITVGEGWHVAAGQPHAEVMALAQAGEAARGGTAFVSLEPCSHHGRTPPCTEALIAAGIARVVFAARDPHPKAAAGADVLRAAGIQVTGGVLAQRAIQQNRFFFHHLAHDRPRVVAKFAASLDGRIATNSGESQWITGPAARQAGHRLRQACDAVLVGAGTVIADNPRLTVRLPEPDVRPAHPLRIVLDSQGRVPLDARVLEGMLPGRTLVATTPAMPRDHREALKDQGVTVLDVEPSLDDQVDLESLLQALSRTEPEVQSILVEAGPHVLGAFADLDLIDEVAAFIAPRLIGGSAPPALAGDGAERLVDTKDLRGVTITPLGQDVLIHGHIHPIPHPDLTEQEQA